MRFILATQECVCSSCLYVLQVRRECHLRRVGIGIRVSTACKHSNMYCSRKQSFSLPISAYLYQVVNDSWRFYTLSCFQFCMKVLVFVVHLINISKKVDFDLRLPFNDRHLTYSIVNLAETYFNLLYFFSRKSLNSYALVGRNNPRILS